MTVRPPVMIGREDFASLLRAGGHLEALTTLASRSLQRGDADLAFLYADRRCRLAQPEPYDLLLRAEALSRLGHERQAEADLLRAFEHDPTDPLVVGRILASGRPEADATARVLIGDPRLEHAARDLVLDYLIAKGVEVAADLRVESGRLAGWVAWAAGHEAVLRVATDRSGFDIALAPDRASDVAWHMARVDAGLAGGLTDATVTLDGRAPRDRVLSIRENPVEPDAGVGSAEVDRYAPAMAPSLITIVIPVYDDVDITRACLESVARQSAPSITIRTFVVDDAAPSAEMRAVVAELCARHGFELILNARNLGFSRTVNKALSGTPEGDVLLLNSDVIMPEGVVARLAEAARSRPGIGIVNPLTNDGQLVSFPVLQEANRFEDADRIAMIDRAAQAVNRGRVVALPNAMGFCMYVTRACLDAVGGLPEIYFRGYHEDVEFCLRAQRKGFDSVCAPDVYVGHKGTSSFKSDKRALVVRNTRALEARFRDHAATIRAFWAADPLRAARADLEEAIDPPTGISVLLAGGVPHRAVLDRRAGALMHEGLGVLVVSWEFQKGSGVFSLHRPGVGRARNLRFDTAEPSATPRLIEWLAGLGMERVELAGSSGPFGVVLAALSGRGVPLAGLLTESLVGAATRRRDCTEPAGPQPCAACLASFEAHWRPNGIGRDLAPLAEGAGAQTPSLIVSMDAMSQEMAIDLTHGVFQACDLVSPTPLRRAAPRRPSRRLLALLAPQRDRAVEAFTLALLGAALHRASVWSFLFVGPAVDPRRLMSGGNLFVTGPVDEPDLFDVASINRAAVLCAPQRWSGFGTLDRLAAETGLPKVYFDWSMGALPVGSPDLALDPRLCDPKAAAHLLDWLDTSLAEAVA